MHFTKSGTTDYVIMKGPAKDLSKVYKSRYEKLLNTIVAILYKLQLSVCLWLHSIDSFNYGTVLSYATMFHDNAFTLTDYNG